MVGPSAPAYHHYSEHHRLLTLGDPLFDRLVVLLCSRPFFLPDYCCIGIYHTPIESENYADFKTATENLMRTNSSE